MRVAPATHLATEAGLRAQPSKLEELYGRCASRAYRLAILLTGDPDAADDLVQDAFVKVAGRFGHLRNRDSFEPYLRRAIVNQARSQIRRRTVERRFISTAQQDVVRNDPDVEMQMDLWHLLLRLPPRQRIALVLRFYEDLTEEQAAEAMNVSPRAINSLVSRGLSRLRAEEGELR